MKKALKGNNIIKFITFIILYTMECLIYYIIPLLLTDYVSENATINKLWFFLIIFIILNVVRIGLRAIMKSIGELYIFYELHYLISNNLAKNIIDANIINTSEKGTGYISKVMDKYNNSIIDLIEMIVFNVPDAVIAIIIFTIASFTKSIMLGVVFLIIILISVFVYVFIQKKQEKYIEAYNIEEAIYNSKYVDYILNLRTVKLLNLNKYVENDLKTKTKVAIKQKEIKYRIDCLKEGIIRFITFIPIVIGILIGISEFENGGNGIGTIVYFVWVSGDFKFIVNAISKTIFRYSEYKMAKQNYDECILNENKIEYIDKFSKVEIKDLKFKYDDSKFEIVIDKFSASKKDNVAIIGKSGQGKTTLLNILSKGIKTNNVYVDDKLTDKNIGFGYVTQEADMFNSTVRENLCLGKDIKDDEIINLLNEVSLKHWYNSLKEGLDTHIGEKGVKLSTGQKQRLNIVRAILQDKQAYILDEPTSNLDEATEEKVVKTIDKYLGSKTLIIVTHRDKVLDICNKVYKMENHILSKVK